MSCVRKHALIINCGFARVSIYENSNPSRVGRDARESIDKQSRATSFKSQFGTCFGIPDGYFEPRVKDNTSQFDRDSNKILDGFKSMFRTDLGYSKQSYLDTFSLARWSELSSMEKSKHTFSKCVRCFESYKEQQSFFPLKPFYQPEPEPAVLTLNTGPLQQQGLKSFTKNVLSELDTVFTNQANTTFTDALLKSKCTKLVTKKTTQEKVKEKRNMQRTIAKNINDQFAEKAAITLLTEGESKRKYHRKRLAQSFFSPNDQPPQKKKKHSPNFTMVEWDTEKLATTLQKWPSGTPINWSKVAKEHGINGGNAGQIAREFAEENQIDISHIPSLTPNRRPNKRPCKKKLPGYGVSVPSNPPLNKVEAEIASMVSSGRFSLGEECSPYTITKYKIIDGALIPNDIIIQARKVPLKQLRQKLLANHLKYMRLTPKSGVEHMTREQITQKLSKIPNFNPESETLDELRQRLMSIERSRSLYMWHDHATILKMGFLMLTVHVVYDSAVFFSDEEYQHLHPGDNINIQAEVEQPETYLISVGSSSIQDQAALIGDRISCLLDLSTPVVTKSGDEITDTLRFFTGDHPAAQFEQGSKQGGTYKCGSCGCKESLFDDQAHALSLEWRTVPQLQSIAIDGTFGRNAGILHPFDNLKVGELRTELRARGQYVDQGMKKEVLQKTLTGILRGVSRVPALLLTDPTQNLASLNLGRYEIVASEPLHDI